MGKKYIKIADRIGYRKQIIDTTQLEKVVSLLGLSIKTRKREVVYERYYFYYRLRESMTLHDIADIFNQDHSTVLTGSRRYEEIKQYPDTIEIVENIKHYVDSCFLSGEYGRSLYTNENEVHCLVMLDALIGEKLKLAV